jgi:hypothetical protein
VNGELNFSELVRFFNELMDPAFDRRVYFSFRVITKSEKYFFNEEDIKNLLIKLELANLELTTGEDFDENDILDNEEVTEVLDKRTNLIFTCIDKNSKKRIYFNDFYNAIKEDKELWGMLDLLDSSMNNQTIFYKIDGKYKQLFSSLLTIEDKLTVILNDVNGMSEECNFYQVLRAGRPQKKVKIGGQLGLSTVIGSRFEQNFNQLARKRNLTDLSYGFHQQENYGLEKALMGWSGNSAAFSDGDLGTSAAKARLDITNSIQENSPSMHLVKSNSNTGIGMGPDSVRVEFKAQLEAIPESPNDCQSIADCDKSRYSLSRGDQVNFRDSEHRLTGESRIVDSGEADEEETPSSNIKYDQDDDKLSMSDNNPASQ